MTKRKPKKDASITIHMPTDHKEQLSSLAEMLRAGQGASEYVYENLIKPHLLKLKAETKIKQKIFGLTENDKNCEQRTDLSVRLEPLDK
ncbi:hypothetical protein AYL20_01405 [Acinetobacter venetianus]|uniref:hypothetical protein n=1 Tax=Acinetobacter venetianus TaxID=52133 RepID=UPI000775D6E9|nr:hypothetical protein [Acinetobacter venetianus]KXO82680.1 hypothetical protein AYL20_01405 [Acinetobacter venetianus]MCR4532738.1 hypothetical protein [Acinetobacter venetianus]